MAFVDPLASFARGQALVDNVFNQRAQRQAAQGLASGNYAQALGALAGAGDIGGVIQVQNAQAQGEERRRSREEAELGRQVAFSRQATRALSQAIQSGQDPLTTFDGMVPAFQALGATPDQVQTYRQALATNPTAFVQQIEQLTNTAARQLEIQNLGNGYGVAIDKTTGEVVNEYQAPQRPVNVGNVLIDPETGEVILDAREPKYQTIQNTDGSTSVVAIDQPAPRAGGAVGGGSGVPRGMRNNNPGNIEDGPFARSLPGYAGSDGRFAIFSDLASGEGAQARLLQSYVQRGFDTPAEIINRWAPPSDNNPTNAYVNYVARRVGVGPNDRISTEQIPLVAQAIREFENGGQSASNGRPAAATSSGGARVVAQGENRGPQVTQLSPQEVAALNLPEGTVAQRRADGSINVVSKGGSERYTEGQRQAAGFAYRLNNAAGTLNRLAQTGTARPSPAILAFGEGRIRENALSSTDRRWLQAAREWLAPVLRKDTGAAVGPGELVTYMGIYLPSPTDDPATLAQKAQARQVAEQALRAQAGGAYAEMFPQAAQPQQRRRAQTNTGGVIPFNLSQQQLARWRELGRSGGDPSAPLGSTRNPRWINEAAAGTSYNNIPRGSYYFDPNGQMRRKN